VNDDDREQWVNNDEDLYVLWKRSRLSLRKFVRENRALIDEHVAARNKHQLPAWIRDKNRLN
jgi:hypothetical protein